MRNTDEGDKLIRMTIAPKFGEMGIILIFNVFLFLKLVHDQSIIMDAM